MRTILCPAALAGLAMACVAIATICSGQNAVALQAVAPHAVSTPVEAHCNASGINHVLIQSPLGSVEVMGQEYDSVDVQASLPCREGIDPKPRVAMVADDGVLMIDPQHADLRFESAALTVKVPKGIRVTIRAAAGPVSCRDLTGILDVQAQSGDITLEHVSGDITAEVSAGDIVVNHAEPWTNDEILRCKTLDGLIHIGIPAGTEFDLAVRSLNAPFVTDFPITLRGTPEATSFEARSGIGGPRIELNTLDGDLLLHRIEQGETSSAAKG